MIAPPLIGVANNRLPGFWIRFGPFTDFSQGSKTSQADVVFVKAAISDAGGINQNFGIYHLTGCPFGLVSEQI